ncbi:MAG: FAD-binding protein, partial [Prolixibacteraceae bacterium]|nr:FAD-binding protein [Prolixibacteraceae bacterium]MBN2772792.1 FAD-binding protein [Prolixibacteraceae bacterium]
KRRILHADGDATGKKLTCFMLRKAKERETVHPFEFTSVVKLLKQNNRVAGVHAIDFKTKENIIFKSNAVILATGGFSRIFVRSTNPHTATGDGIALAYEAGARIADMEFVQFHPSALSIPGEDAFLISEAVRGEGAWLLNEKGERFMKDIHPLAELAPRDVVAYSIYRQIEKSENKVVYLSLKHLNSGHIKKRFHNIEEKLSEFGYDLTKDTIPISPAAHYMVGGIRSGLNGETNLKGLFVCGETASTGVMGANRLASNSLAECLVFGKRASESAARLKPFDYDATSINPVTINQNNETLFLKYKNEIAEILTNYVGIVRNREGLTKALKRLEMISKEFDDFKNEYNLLKIKSAAAIGLLITKGALIREESRGGHIREDFQKQSPEFKAHTIQQKNRKISFEQL